MPFVYHFSPEAMSAERYAECIARLAEAGASHPPGRLYHVAYGSVDGLRVFDVWESAQAFEQFGATLVPILHDLGVDPGNPEVSEILNIIPGP
jgi:hypothetical protein